MQKRKSRQKRAEDREKELNKPLRLKRYASDQWAIVSADGSLCYVIGPTKKEAIRSFMNNVNSDPDRQHLTWADLKYPIAVKVRIAIRHD